MEIKGTKVARVPTQYTGPAFVFDKHPLELATAFRNGFLEILGTVCIATFLEFGHGIHSIIYRQ
jgi:hypothetical protein